MVDFYFFFDSIVQTMFIILCCLVILAVFLCEYIKIVPISMMVMTIGLIGMGAFSSSTHHPESFDEAKLLEARVSQSVFFDEFGEESIILDKNREVLYSSNTNKGKLTIKYDRESEEYTDTIFVVSEDSNYVEYEIEVSLNGDVSFTEI